MPRRPDARSRAKVNNEYQLESGIVSRLHCFLNTADM